jgi:hypothetical protein
MPERWFLHQAFCVCLLLFYIVLKQFWQKNLPRQNFFTEKWFHIRPLRIGLIISSTAKCWDCPVEPGNDSIRRFEGIPLDSWSGQGPVRNDGARNKDQARMTKRGFAFFAGFSRYFLFFATLWLCGFVWDALFLLQSRSFFSAHSPGFLIRSRTGQEWRSSSRAMTVVAVGLK